MPAPFNAEQPRSAGNACGGGLFLGVSLAFHSKRVEPQHSPVLGFPTIHVYTLQHRGQNSAWKHMRQRHVLGG